MKRIHRTLLTFLAAISIALGQAAAAQDGADYELTVDGLACPFCAYGIEKHLRRLEAVEKVGTDVAAGTVELWTAGDGELSRAEVERAVSDAGFKLKDFRKLDDGA